MKATGQFEVKLNPLNSYIKGEQEVAIGRMSIDKTFTGDLSATSQGEMLSARSPVQGSAGYVAIEQVKGKLGGKEGTFVLQHFGTMSGKGQSLTLEVVPDSGTGDLSGLTGTMAINIENGQHFYEFEYRLVD